MKRLEMLYSSCLARVFVPLGLMVLCSLSCNFFTSAAYRDDYFTIDDCYCWEFLFLVSGMLVYAAFELGRYRHECRSQEDTVTSMLKNCQPQMEARARKQIKEGQLEACLAEMHVFHQFITHKQLPPQMQARTLPVQNIATSEPDVADNTSGL